MALNRTDWYPRTQEGKREMFNAIRANIDSVDTNLNMEPAKRERLKAMADVFIAFDKAVRLNQAALKSLLTGFKTMANGRRGIDPMPDVPKFHEFVMPTGDFVGMEAEMREMRRYMTGLFTWTENMGDLLKMNGSETAGRNVSEMSPSVVIKQIAGNRISASTKKEAMDGIEYQWREAGANVWQPLTNSGETNSVLEIPLAAGAAAKIELRAIYCKEIQARRQLVADL